MRTRIITFIIIAAVFSGIAFKLNEVSHDRKEEIRLVEKSKADVPVTVVAAQYRDSYYDISYNGTFESNYEVTVVSEAQGKVKDYFIEEGEFVPEGKVIALLENDIITYQLETAEAAFQKTLSDLKRFEKLSPGEAVSTQELEEIGLAEKNARNTWLTLKKQYENTFIKAPVAGTVSKRYIERGAFITQGAPVIDITDNRRMKFCAWFSATDLLKAEIGQKVIISTDLYPDTSFNGIIKVINIKPDESRRYRVVAEIQNNSIRSILPGTDGTLLIRIKQDKKDILIPDNCIIGSLKDPKVYIVEAGISRLRPVKIGGIINGQATITGGLNEGDQVVKTGLINLQDSTKVNVINSETL